MIHVDQAIKDAGLSEKVHMIMQIHDELVFEVVDGLLDQAQDLIKKTMEQVLEKVPLKIENKIPIDVSISSGKTWGEAKD
jgi:DNA polymerase-1